MSDIVKRAIGIAAGIAAYLLFDLVRDLRRARWRRFAGHRRPREISNWILSCYLEKKKRGDP